VDLVADASRLIFARICHARARSWLGSDHARDAAEHEHSLAMLADVAREAGVDAELRCQASPSVGHGLHDLAQAESADLIVVGSSRHGVVGRVLLGDDTRGALDGAPCAIAVAPAGYAQRPRLIREVGVGYNGSPESKHALSVARDLAEEHGAKLSAFEAVTIPAIALSTGPLPIDRWMDDLLDDARRRVSSLDGVEPHAVYGKAAEELAMFSASVDVLVVGARDYGPVGRLIHGSTSRELVRDARCPLLVLPRATGDRNGVADTTTPADTRSPA
jgi:nucleotide-binding universal stress UspA family protein